MQVAWNPCALFNKDLVILNESVLKIRDGMLNEMKKIKYFGKTLLLRKTILQTTL